mgnify:CR=1 FL=1
MKKVLGILLALALCVSLAAPALAAESQGITRGEAAQALVDLCGLTGELADYAAKESPFSDVSEDDACKAAAALLADKGLMQGDGSGAFHPERALTSLEAAVVLLRWAGLSESVIGWPRASPSRWTAR